MRIIIVMILLSVLLFACSQKQVQDNLPQIQQNATAAQPVAVNETPAAAPAKIACTSDSDCGVPRAENAYCFQDNPVGDLYEPKCENPGTAKARCKEIHKSGSIAQCGDTTFCQKGACVSYANCNDTDGGMNFTVKGKVLTNDLRVYEDYCKDDQTLMEYYCSTDERAFSEKETCKCSAGACEEEAATNQK